MKIRELNTPSWLINSQYVLLLIYIIIGVINWRIVIMQLYQLTLYNGIPGILLLSTLLLLQVFHTWYHEHGHFLSAKWLGYEATVYIKAKKCIPQGEIKALHFFLIAIAPFLFDCLLLYGLYSAFPEQIFLLALFAILVLSSSLSDIYYALSSLSYVFKRAFYYMYEGGPSGKGRFGLYKKID